MSENEKDDLTTKIHIYDAVLRGWDRLPENFGLSDFMDICNLQEHSKRSVSQQLLHMKQLGIISMNSRKMYRKEHLKLDRWFAKYIDKLRDQADRQELQANI